MYVHLLLIPGKLLFGMFSVDSACRYPLSDFQVLVFSLVLTFSIFGCLTLNQAIFILPHEVRRPAACGGDFILQWRAVWQRRS